MRLRNCLRMGAVFFFSCGAASAATLLNVTDTLASTDPTQLGRLSRNGIQQDWVGTEPFPGVINPGTSYFYQTYSVNVGVTSFIQITFDDTGPSEFVSAYVGAYLPDSAGAPNFGLDTNWLGDAGSSGNLSGGGPRSFQVIAAANSNLIVVVNNTTGGVFLPLNNGTYNLHVEGFIDQNFDNPPPAVPEPSSRLFLTVGLLGLTGLAYSKRPRHSSRRSSRI